MINKNPKIFVMGAGSVGCFFGGMLARAGKDVTLIARQMHVEAIRQNGLYMECINFQEYVPVKATVDISSIQDADIILLCVKSPDTQKTIESIRAYLKQDVVILSLQNGVSNCDVIKQHIPMHVYPTVVYVATGMVGPGHLKHFGRGELLVGDLDNQHLVNDLVKQELEMLSEIFSSSSVPCDISENIKYELWSKFLVNCCYNGISAIGQMPYGKMAAQPEIRALIDQITKEFLLIAHQEGVVITPEQAAHLNQQIATSMSGQRSSTAQDLSRKKPTEIDYLNGLIVKKGQDYGIETPANQSVYALVKMMEESY